jgi:RecG-like helicase
MPHPEIEAMSEHEQSLRSMQPVYPSTETLTNRGISNRVININATVIPRNSNVVYRNLAGLSDAGITTDF